MACNRPVTSKLSRDLHFVQKWKDPVENSKMAKFEAPRIKGDFVSV